MSGQRDHVTRPRQRVTVFQQNGSGERKIAGVRRYGADIIALEVVSIDIILPAIIDVSDAYLPRQLDTGLVLDFLKHGDLSLDLAERCANQKIPIVSSGRKRPDTWSLTPPT